MGYRRIIEFYISFKHFYYCNWYYIFSAQLHFSQDPCI